MIICKHLLPLILCKRALLLNVNEYAYSIHSLIYIHILFVLLLSEILATITLAVASR